MILIRGEEILVLRGNSWEPDVDSHRRSHCSVLELEIDGDWMKQCSYEMV